MAVLDEIAAERVGMAELLDTLSAAQLATPSLCGEWTVRQTGAHLLMAITVSLPRFVTALVRARGNFDVANDRVTRAFAERPVAEISAGLRAQARNAFHPPGFGLEAQMAEQVLHGQDIRRPLGLELDFSEDALCTVLDMLASPKAERGFVPKRLRLRDGLRFEASDLDWTFGPGDAALVRGPAASVAYAMTGRTASLGELTGAGVAELTVRGARR
jgi:uncharacterized protein (TIGR03083 family)